MSKVKFKAWNKINKTMHHDILNPDNWSFSFLDQDIFEWLQFTGLKDVYEGDIISAEDWFGQPVTGKVLFDETGVWKVEAFGRHPDREYLHELVKRESFKILGNIHENP